MVLACMETLAFAVLTGVSASGASGKLSLSLRTRQPNASGNMTAAMHNLGRAPYVSHEEGTALVIAHIARYWCPSISSDEIMR